MEDQNPPPPSTAASPEPAPELAPAAAPPTAPMAAAAVEPVSPYRPVVVALLFSAIIVGGSLMGSAMYVGDKLDALNAKIGDIGTLGGGGGGGGKKQADDEDAPKADQAKLLSKSDPKRGADDAPITIVEFSDYQCPFCERFYQQTLPALFKEYGDKVRFVYKDFPLPMHPDAQKAAEAAHCAGEQGKYWEYHNTLFENQSSLGIESLKHYAKALNLDTSRFDACLDGGKQADKVKEDTKIGRSVSVNGTPTFFINGERLVGAQPIDAFKEKIDALLKK